MEQKTLQRRSLMMGNEAFARGAYEGGARVACGYPGTPSSEILAFLSRYSEVHSRWCPNEKVALEVAGGSAIAGSRSLATMKHVGLNVAADPLLTLAYTGLEAGLVVIVADDPGMHSSQNEQDSRNYASFAKIPALEPSNSQEALNFTRIAFELSERFDTPVMVRSTTRISHARTLVHTQERIDHSVMEYRKNAEKYVMIPAFARKRRYAVEERLKRLRDWVESTDLNQREDGNGELGIITGGVVYTYLKDILPDASFFKLGVSHPLPIEALADFAGSVKRAMVVEELDSIWEREIMAAGIQVTGRKLVPGVGELTPDILRSIFHSEKPAPPGKSLTELTLPRPPVLCAGCPHRGVFRVLADMKALVTGDIGCYTLGVMPPMSSIDTCICMGASVSMAEGFQLTHPERPIAAVIGDSTFIHGGITPLIDAVYNDTPIVVVILDNGTTAMTGGQDHPATGKTLMGDPAHHLDLPQLCRSLGVRFVQTVPSYDMTRLREVLQEAVEFPGPAVVVTQEPCRLMVKTPAPVTYRIDDTRCSRCQKCIQLGCPAIEFRDDQIVIVIERCSGCGVCQTVCRFEAISEVNDHA